MTPTELSTGQERERETGGGRSERKREREMKLSSTYSSPLSTYHSLLLPASTPFYPSPPFYSPYFSLSISLFATAHLLQVTVSTLFHTSVSASISPPLCGALVSAPSERWPAKFGTCERKTERKTNLKREVTTVLLKLKD